MATAELPSSLESFLARWSNAAASERANAQLFLTEPADLIEVPRPGNYHAADYAESLRAAYPEVTESADFVMYWWHKAVALGTERSSACRMESSSR